MLIYYVVCMLLTFFAIEYFITSGINAAEHRLLPLILGLIAVYDFYLIVEYITQDFEVFKVLKELLALQFSLLVFYYILDFMRVKLKTWTNVIIFFILTVINVFVIYQYRSGNSITDIINAFIIIVFLIIVVFATVALIFKSYTKKIHWVYHHLYMIMLIPCLAVILDMFGIVEGRYVVPGALGVFCIGIIAMEIRGSFTETSNYLKDNLFQSYEGHVVLLDSQFNFVEASARTRAAFPDIISEMSRNRHNYIYMDTFKEWADIDDGNHLLELRGRYYKGDVQRVYRKSKIQGYIFSFADITDEMDSIEDAKTQARQKSSFLANMSHELRSPLHAIIGGSEIIRHNGEISTRNEFMLSQIEQSGLQLLDKVNSILDYSKMEAGMLELASVEYNIRDLLENIANNSYIVLKDKPIEFKVIYKSDIPRRLRGDSKRVATMMQNLISNASKFTTEGYINCSLEAEKISDEQVRFIFTVEDSGIGIEESKISEIFDEYKTAVDGNKYESTGLGLPLVKEISELMGGNVSVESDGVSGSVFRVEFLQELVSLPDEFYQPSVIDSFDLSMLASATSLNVEPSYIYPTASVLVVDDMAVNREIFRGMARPWGFEIREASSGKDAIELVKESDCDVIILDHMMPGMSGLECADELKKISHAKIIISSANISEELLSDVVCHDLDGYIPKPVNMQTFKEVLEDNLPKDKREMTSFVDMVSNEILKDRVYELTLAAYVEELQELIPELDVYKDSDMDSFRVKVHGIKGISRQLGRVKLGDFAEIMEMAAKSEHKIFIEDHYDSFINEIKINLSQARREMEG